MTTYYTTLPSPFGTVCIVGTVAGLTQVDFQLGDRPVQPQQDWQQDDRPLHEARRQLQEYFQARRRAFTVPLAPAGTPFQQRVWRALQQIPYGTTCTYHDLAQHLGKPGAARAVGHANGRNPIAIMIPCHRLIGRDGTLRGYASGLELKQRLLEHEKAR